MLLPFMPGLYMSVVVIIVMDVVSVVLPLVPFTPGTVMIKTTLFVTTVAVRDASEGKSCISSARMAVICSTAIVSKDILLDSAAWIAASVPKCPGNSMM